MFILKSVVTMVDVIKILTMYQTLLGRITATPKMPMS